MQVTGHGVSAITTDILPRLQSDKAYKADCGIQIGLCLPIPSDTSIWTTEAIEKMD